MNQNTIVGFPTGYQIHITTWENDGDALMDKYKYAKIAYKTYMNQTIIDCPGLDDSCYEWEKLSPKIKDKWFVTAEAIIETYNVQFEDDLK